MPKTAYFPKDATRAGIDITYTKRSNTLSVSGWYDSMVGIEPTTIGPKEFFDSLGITEADIKRAFKK